MFIVFGGPWHRKVWKSLFLIKSYTRSEIVTYRKWLFVLGQRLYSFFLLSKDEIFCTEDWLTSTSVGLVVCVSSVSTVHIITVNGNSVNAVEPSSVPLSHLSFLRFNLLKALQPKHRLQQMLSSPTASPAWDSESVSYDIGHDCSNTLLCYVFTLRPTQNQIICYSGAYVQNLRGQAFDKVLIDWN